MAGNKGPRRGGAPGRSGGSGTGPNTPRGGRTPSARRAAGRAPRPPGGGGGGKKGACDMWIPIVIPALLFYALPRMFFDWLRGR